MEPPVTEWLVCLDAAKFFGCYSFDAPSLQDPKRNDLSLQLLICPDSPGPFFQGAIRERVDVVECGHYRFQSGGLDSELGDVEFRNLSFAGHGFR